MRDRHVHAYVGGFIKTKGIEKGGRKGGYQPQRTGVEEEKKKAERERGEERETGREKQKEAKSCLSLLRRDRKES